MNENNDDKNLTKIKVENDQDITNKPEEGTKIKAQDGKEYMTMREAEIGWFKSSVVAVEQDNFQNRVRLTTGWNYYFWGAIGSGAIALIGTGVALLAYFKKKNRPEPENNNPSNSEPETKEPNQGANNPPPPPPLPENKQTEPEPKEEKTPDQPTKKGDWNEIHKKIKERRKKVEDED